MLDSQTTLVIATTLFLVLPLIKWLVLPRHSNWDVDMWCLGGLMAGVGIVLLGLRAQVPTFVSFHLANTLILGCFVCSVQSLRITWGRAWTAWGWTGRMLAAFLFYSALYAWTSDEWRGVLYRFALGLMGLYTATWAWRLSRRMQSLSAAIIGVAHSVAGLALVAHSLWTAGHTADPSPFSNTWDASVLSLVVLLMTAMTSLSYVGMVLDLAARDQLQAQQDQQTALQTQLLDTQLSNLERRGRMAMVSGTLAHELNQPLTAASMNAQVAQRYGTMPLLPGPILLDLLDKIEAGVHRTTHILNRIRQENEQTAQHLERVNLQQVLDDALAQMAPEIQQLGVLVTHPRSAQPVWCLGDELGLSQVVVNLLRNAIQAMAKQPERRLWVACGTDQAQAQITVRDSGPGMTAQGLAHWGEAFQTTQPEGMGLGLVISRDIVSRHQGQLLISNHPQGGLQALVSLPLAEEATA